MASNMFKTGEELPHNKQLNRKNFLTHDQLVSSSQRPLLVNQPRIHYLEPRAPTRRPLYKKKWSDLGGVLRSASRDSMLRNKESSPAPSEDSLTSTGRHIRNKVKSVFKGRLKSTTSSGDLSQSNGSLNKPQSPTILIPPINNNHVKSNLAIERELEVGLSFLLTLPKSGKLEMLGGTADAVFNAVVKALDKADKEKVDKAAVDCVNKSLKAVLSWVDGLLLDKCNLGGKASTPLTPAEEDGVKLCADLRKAVSNLSVYAGGSLASREPGSRISADSGNQSIMEDSVVSNASSSHSPPPKPPHPPSLNRFKQPPSPNCLPSTTGILKNPPGRRFVADSKTDSGIFTGNESSGTETSPSDCNGNHMFSPSDYDHNKTIIEENDRLFRDGSLDDLLHRLNLAEPGNDSPDGCNLFDAKEQVHQNELRSHKVMTDDSGRQVKTTRVMTSKQVVRQAMTTTTATITSDECPDDILQRLQSLASSGKEYKTSKTEQFRMQSGSSSVLFKNLSKIQDDASDLAGRLSPYDNNVTSFPLHPPPIPPRGKAPIPPARPSKNLSLSETINTMNLIDDTDDELTPLESAPRFPTSKFPIPSNISERTSSWSSACVRSEHRAEKDGVEKVNVSSTSASNTHATHNGKLLAQVDTYSQDDEGFWHRTKDLYPDAPPLPPRRKNVMNYVRILGPGQVESTTSNTTNKEEGCETMNNPSEVPLLLTTNLKAFSLSSYVVLRDKWRLHEQRLSNPDVGLSLPAFPSLQNLSELISWPENSFQLPRALSKKSTSNKSSEGKKAINFVERLALPSSEILSSLDASDWLILRQKTPESPQEVRGGPVDALVVHSTLPGPQVLLYQEAFLTTYRTFITPAELICNLIWRYDQLMKFTATQPSQSHTKTAKNTLSILVRVVDELCPSEISQKVVEEVNNFQYRLIDQGQLSLSRVLRQRILDRIEYKAGFKDFQPLYPNPPASPNIKEPNLHDVKADCMAQQLTVIDSEFFQKIELSELIWWAKEQSEEKSPNLARFTEHFNRMSFWCRSRVLLPNEHKEKEKVFIKLIKVMKCLRQMGNFNSYLAILSALDSGPVRRLDWSSNIVDSLKEHSRVMDSSSSFKIYRQLLADTPPPCLPYLGLILQDLTFVHIGNPDSLPADLCLGRGDLINFVKRWQQYAILDSVRRFKSWPYNLKRDDEKAAIFNNFDNFLTEDETWQLSETIKPRTRSSGAKRLYTRDL